MMWESQTNTWEWTGHHKTYEVPLCNMCGTVRKRKASSLICSHIRSHRFLSGLDSQSLVSQPSAHCLPVVAWMGVPHSLIDSVQHGYFTQREKWGTGAAPLCSTLGHHLQSVKSLVFQRGSAGQAHPGELIPARGDCQFSSTEREQTHQDTSSCLNK